ncbi:hypothetical protein HID58_018749 [Brassica napus]|uniref:WAT1-related protein n=1 Tax=Brassica napus TaxID=3708 RepID=A0ABQ8DBA7_BRANA|nr:hypothetical protein HID58_018749 [Brassica napus]
MEESKRPPCCSRAILMDWFSANRSIPFTILLYGIAGTSLLAISMKLSLRKLLLLWSPLAWLILGYIHMIVGPICYVIQRDNWFHILKPSPKGLSFLLIMFIQRVSNSVYILTLGRFKLHAPLEGIFVLLEQVAK